MIIIGVLLFGVLFLGAVVAVIWFGLFKVEHDQKNAEKNAEALLDEAFDGRPDVTYKIHLRSLKYETVIAGAKARGYVVTHQAGESSAMTLIFEKERSRA